MLSHAQVRCLCGKELDPKHFANPGLLHAAGSNSTYFESSKADRFNATIANITGVPSCWVELQNVTTWSVDNGTVVQQLPNARRLLQTPGLFTLGDPTSIQGSPVTAEGRRRLLQNGVPNNTPALGIGFAVHTDNVAQANTDLANSLLYTAPNSIDTSPMGVALQPNPLGLTLLGYTNAAQVTTGVSSSAVAILS